MNTNRFIIGNVLPLPSAMYDIFRESDISFEENGKDLIFYSKEDYKQASKIMFALRLEMHGL